MEIKTYYDRPYKVWVAYPTDDDGNQVGFAQYHVNKDMAIFWAGVEYCKNTTQHQEQTA